MNDPETDAAAPEGSRAPAPDPAAYSASLSSPAGTDRLLFVLRLWSEPDGAGSERSPLRGSVERLDTQELRYFDQLSSLEGLLEEMVKETSP